VRKRVVRPENALDARAEAFIAGLKEKLKTLTARDSDTPHDGKSWQEARTREIDDELQRIEDENRPVADPEPTAASEKTLSPEAQGLFDRLREVLKGVDEEQDVRAKARERELEDSRQRNVRLEAKVKELEDKLQRLQAQNRAVAEQDEQGMGNVERGVEDLSLEERGMEGDQGMSLPEYTGWSTAIDSLQRWLRQSRNRR